MNGVDDYTINIKKGSYQIKVAYGTEWYGLKEMFGDEKGEYYILEFEKNDSIMINSDCEFTFGIKNGNSNLIKIYCSDF